MIPFETALHIVLSSARYTGTERVPLEESLHRILAADTVSDVDIPPADTSAMDGYACRSADTGGPLRIVETVSAGSLPRKVIGPGECAKIMTGAILPSGADWVEMREHTIEEDGVMRIVDHGRSANVRRKAENVRAGDTVIRRGTPITPPVIAALASIGCDPVSVAKQQLVGVIATGNELVAPSFRPGPGQIRDSNSLQLCSQISLAGARVCHRGIVADTRQGLAAAAKGAIDECDVVLLSGGVSAGDFDFVPAVLREIGVELLFERVAIKPGKPAVFGTKDGRYVFGLPGNPVSAFVMFEMMIKPLLYACGGCAVSSLAVSAGLGQTLARKKSDRIEFVPVTLAKDGMAYPVSYLGSAHIHAYAMADGMIAIPRGVLTVEKGTIVMVYFTDAFGGGHAR